MPVLPRRRPRALVALVLLVLALPAAVLVLRRPELPAAELEARYATPPSRFLVLRDAALFGPAGLRVHYRDEGPRGAPVLLLVHGSGASLFTWEGWARALAQDFRVVSLDLPGHGLTGPHPLGRYGVDDHVAVLEALRAALGLERVHLAGNSLGGHVAWRYALAHPGRVERLVLVDAAGYPREEGPPLAFRLAALPVLGPLLLELSPRAVVARSVREVYGDPSRVTDALVDRYDALLSREGNRRATLARARDMGAPDDGRWRELPRLRAPTLVLWGGRDTWILPRYGERFARDIPGARLVTFPALGHVPMEEDPAATAEVVRAFLREGARQRPSP